MIVVPDFDASAVSGVINCMKHGLTMSTSRVVDRMRELIGLLLSVPDAESLEPIHTPTQNTLTAMASSNGPVDIWPYNPIQPEVVIKEEWWQQPDQCTLEQGYFLDIYFWHNKVQ